MQTTTNGNGRPQRKSLASQLDRLDTILDTLDEGLQGAVATAVQEAITQAVQAAVQTAIIEVLSNNELQQRLHSSLPSHPQTGVPALRQWWASMKTGWIKAVTIAGELASKVVRRIQEGVRAASSRTQRACQRPKAILKATWMRLLLASTLARRLRKPLIAALGVGVTVGVGCYFAGPVVASWVSGVAGFAGSLSASACNALRRMLVREELQRG